MKPWECTLYTREILQKLCLNAADFFKKKKKVIQVWWLKPVIPGLRSSRQGNLREFEAARVR